MFESIADFLAKQVWIIIVLILLAGLVHFSEWWTGLFVKPYKPDEDDKE